MIMARDEVIGPISHEKFRGFRFLTADARACFGRNVMENDPRHSGLSANRGWRSLALYARSSKIRWMRDGIYSFDIRSDEWVTNGIVLIENNAIRGFNSNHVYIVERTINSGRTRWHVSEIRYVSHTQGFSIRGFPATLDGEEGLDWFRLEGESDADADVNVKIEIQGWRLCDLPWPRADKSLDRSDA